MREAFICDGIRTPIGRYAGMLSCVRTDDLAAHPLKQLIQRNAGVDWNAVDEVILGCANQAGEDNRNVARMAVLLSGLPVTTPGLTVNRLCASGMEAVGQAARAIMTGEADLVIAGGVESMSRAPFAMAKSTSAFDRNAEIYDTTIGWRFVNKQIAEQYGIDSMPETAENLSRERNISRDDQDAYALRSQQRSTASAAARAEEIAPVEIPGRKGETICVKEDEHPRPDATLESLSKLKPLQAGGTVTAGNSSGINDGSAALLIASEEAVKKHGLTPRARILGMASAAVEPRFMGIGPVPSTRKLLSRLNLTLDQMDLIELNEAFASQVLAVTRELGLQDNDPRVNPNGGGIALGHPLGMTGARLILAATLELQRRKTKLALCTLCVGVGQGVSMIVERA
ncbi:MAG: acetyl-CoA acyltransferase [Fimbriimonadaceae bacterium]|jgi:3-oxoadipyl-CoA thiolase|nr:acetyl-CoA acyltransferase [Fimbriimonadaceae bacterium]